MEEIKEAASKLAPDEQFELFQWWIQSETFKDRQLAALKHNLAKGLDDLSNGRYLSYDESTAMRLAEDVGVSGRARLSKGAKVPPE